MTCAGAVAVWKGFTGFCSSIKSKEILDEWQNSYCF